LNRSKELEKGISDIVGVFSDPIIVWPGGGWEDTLPDWIKGAITMERLIENMKSLKGEEPTGTDAEALAYMYPLTLSHPIDRDWTQIYCYLTTTVMEKHNPYNREGGKIMPDDVRVDKLDKEQERDLAQLKAWIYEKRKGARLERDRTERRQEKEEEVAERKVAQPALFDFQ